MVRSTLVAAAFLCAASGCGASEPSRGPVSVTVTAGGPVSGAEVLFLDGDGRVAASVATDAQGRASAVVERGGSVTVARFQPGSTNLWSIVTISEVEPGDALVLDPFGIYAIGTRSGRAQVTFPGPFEGALQYSANLGCSGSLLAGAPDPVGVPLFTNCGSEVDAIAMAWGGQGHLAWSAVTGVPVTGTAPDQTATVAFGPWRSDQGTLELTATNPPAAGGLLTAHLEPRRNGRPFAQSSTAAGQALAPTGATTLSLPYARDFWTSAQLSLGVVHDDGSGAGLVENETSFASRTIDLASALPPPLSRLTVSETNGRRTAGWTRAAPDAGLDGTVLRASWGDAATVWWWRVVLPPGRTAFTFPARLAEAADFLPTAGAPLLFAEVVSYDVPTAGAYCDFRQRHASFVDGIQGVGPMMVRFTKTVLSP